MEKQIIGFENYWITDNGEVFNYRGKGKTKRFIKVITKKEGYLQVPISINSTGKQKQFYVHRLVAQHFIENSLNISCVNHKDGNKKNNNVTNLEWCTHKENSVHAFSNNLVKITKGENHHLAKLTKKQVIEIMEALKNGAKGKDLAKKYNLHVTAISGLKVGKHYKEITSKYNLESFRTVNLTKLKNNINEINELIKLGLSDVKIGKRFNIPRKLIAKYKNNNDIV
jgi:DNA-binding NarL/FixJ family response regulator